MSDNYTVNVQGVARQREFATLREAKEYGVKKAQEEADKNEDGESRSYIVHAVTFAAPVGRRGIPVAATGTAYPRGVSPLLTGGIPVAATKPSTEPQFNPAPPEEKD